MKKLLFIFALLLPIVTMGQGFYWSHGTATATSQPTVTTGAISSITDISATGGGEVVSSGGGTVTARGVCWSSSITSPTIADSHTSDGTGIGTFTSALTGLSGCTTYYVRAYATNSLGPAYGSMVSFTTLKPTAATNEWRLIYEMNGLSITSCGTALAAYQDWLAHGVTSSRSAWVLFTAHATPTVGDALYASPCGAPWSTSGWFLMANTTYTTHKRVYISNRTIMSVEEPGAACPTGGEPR